MDAMTKLVDTAAKAEDKPEGRDEHLQHIHDEYQKMALLVTESEMATRQARADLNAAIAERNRTVSALESQLDAAKATIKALRARGQ